MTRSKLQELYLQYLEEWLQWREQEDRKDRPESLFCGGDDLKDGAFWWSQANGITDRNALARLMSQRFEECGLNHVYPFIDDKVTRMQSLSGYWRAKQDKRLWENPRQLKWVKEEVARLKAQHETA